MSELGYLYVIEFSNGNIKVGRTRNPEKRLSQHRASGVALGVPVTRTWVSDAHEDTQETERLLLNSLPAPIAAREWFNVLFVEAVDAAKSVIELKTEPEMYHKRLMDAVRLIEQHTGRKVDLSDGLAPVPELALEAYFQRVPGAYVMSQTAFDHYVQHGGTLTQKQFLVALEALGVQRRRAYDGSRLYGIVMRP